MKCMRETMEHIRLRAPAGDGGKLIAPPLDRVGEVLECNGALAAAYDYDVQGRSLAQLTEQARSELVQAAWAYTRSYRDIRRPAVEPTTRLILAGHQPQLFHPGVWFKNFVLHEIAARHGGVAINLVIDSDTIKTAAIRVPSGTVQEPIVESVPLDRQSAEIPYEARQIVDRECLESFGRRAAERIRPLVAHPFVEAFWPLVAERAESGRNLGEVIAQARHVQEGRWGSTTYEIPQSHVCDLPAFHWFTCHVLARLPQFWDVYNRSVADYRRANHVRSSAHPVPDLAAEDDWLEAPFWIWDTNDPSRRRLFVRQRGDEILLSDRQAFEAALSLTPEGDAARAADQLAELAGGGIRIRTRALVTTLFARLLLGDLFLHGIGGAKYDKVTDAIIDRFFGLKPPEYMTVTATLRLPIARAEVTPDDARRIQSLLRDQAYHPERHLSADGDATLAALVDRKRQWIATEPTPQTARLRCRNIRAANEQMQAYLGDQRRQLIHQRAVIEAGLRNKAILSSRDYAFCLYPEAALRQLMGV
ncbi:MAG: hypothetical protein WD845_00580 [Pirellulales bacterium]